MDAFHKENKTLTSKTMRNFHTLYLSELNQV